MDLEETIERERKKEEILPSIKHSEELKEFQKVKIDGYEYEIPKIALNMIGQREELLSMSYENIKIYDIALRHAIPILETYSHMIGGKAALATELLVDLKEEFPHLFPEEKEDAKK